MVRSTRTTSRGSSWTRCQSFALNVARHEWRSQRHHHLAKISDVMFERRDAASFGVGFRGDVCHAQSPRCASCRALWKAHTAAIDQLGSSRPFSNPVPRQLACGMANMRLARGGPIGTTVLLLLMVEPVSCSAMGC
jgi:hypothetical protein